MSRARINAIVAAFLMLGSLGAAEGLKPRIHLADQREKIELESIFPREFAGWRVDDRLPVQLVSPDTQALLNKIYNQTLSRTYVNAQGQRIMLSVAYGGDQSDGTRAHRPEVCYPAQGFQVLSTQDTQLSFNGQYDMPVRRLVTRLGGRVEPLTYWIVVGEQVALSGTQQKLLQLRYSVQGLIPDGLLMRVSSIDPDSKLAFPVQDRFLQDLLSALPGKWRPRVFGAPPGANLSS